MKKYQHLIWILFLLITGIFVVINFLSSLDHQAKFIPSREVRALWFSRFEFSRASITHDQDSIRTYIRDIIESAADANFNMIFFQIRGNGDAYYRSDIEPWGHLLTGEFGKNPGWDPLEFAISVAHENGIELHAWLNTFPVWRGKTPPPETEPLSPYLAHPDWLVCDSSGNQQPLSDHYVSFSPGIPAVHDYLITLVKDIVRRYDVDGIHFDYIRYPEGSIQNGYSHDAISVSRYNSKKGNPLNLNFADWQREQLNAFVCRMYDAVKSVKPYVKMSAAAIGSYDHGRWNGYGSVFQDARRWMELGKIDFITPMTYWERSHPIQPYIERVLQWHNMRYNRYVFPGIGIYRFNKRNDLDWSEARGEIKFLRTHKIPGMVFFSAQSVVPHFQELKTKQYKTPALPPVMNWTNSRPPNPPENVIYSVENDKLLLSWHPPLLSPDGELPKYYCIYSSDKSPVDLSDGNNLIRIVPGSQLKIEFEMRKTDLEDFLFITSIDNYYNESVPVEIEIEDD